MVEKPIIGVDMTVQASPYTMRGHCTGFGEEYGGEAPWKLRNQRVPRLYPASRVPSASLTTALALISAITASKCCLRFR